MLIIRVKAHLLLIVGNKIVTKKRRNRFVVGFMCKGNKRQNIRKNKAGEKRNNLFLFASIYILLSIKVGLVRFGYIDKGIN